MNDKSPRLLSNLLLDDHIHGDPNAPVTLIEYGDFQCPHCGEAYGVVKALQQSFREHLCFVYRSFPLQDHPDDRANAEAALSKLEAVDRRISDEVYKKASKAGAGADQPAGESARTGRASSTRESSKPDDVIDADYKVVDETKPDA